MGASQRLGALVLLIDCVMIIALQGQAQKSTPSLVDVLNASEFGFRRFEDVTNRVSLNPVASLPLSQDLVNSSRTLLRSTLQAVAVGRRDLAEIQSHGATSVPQLFELYDDLLYAASTSRELAVSVGIDNDSKLHLELMKNATYLTETSNQLRPYVLQSIRELETQFRSCRQTQK
jgi:hypothetical protein